ncbi:hypothetical protein LB566_27180 [Mesorhizobium sp. CA13]|uniref:hypothetical protein n=1 Tax=unclassified Mesorhizobium TaxID=325217 RepID=UPI00112AD6F2|nr:MULTISPECIES: hypothetical protein [unclassified Mesorhizobium]MBZ9857474.1 hypothetical protein [Mesorhizobium sp. CA13]MBZ9922227.1 hypothetical protein [Mesorhizobium sp. BR1-1-7]MBZ9966679.1 hypothetical protein [Mesorhizobium sp. BR1-1-2]MCA0014843.1 hypothetical protein [Mesorhizobium sp. B294B1A1]MCA0041037.1 hypothetical protein [Mesorhizobium sp. B292B1B]
MAFSDKQRRFVDEYSWSGWSAQHHGRGGVDHFIGSGRHMTCAASRHPTLNFTVSGEPQVARPVT